MNLSSTFTYEAEILACNAESILSSTLFIPNLQEFIKVYSNPTNDRISIERNHPLLRKETTVSLLSQLGRRVYELKVPAGEFFSFDLSNYLPGVYYLRLYSSDAWTVIPMIKQ